MGEKLSLRLCLHYQFYFFGTHGFGNILCTVVTLIRLIMIDRQSYDDDYGTHKIGHAWFYGVDINS